MVPEWVQKIESWFKRGEVAVDTELHKFLPESVIVGMETEGKKVLATAVGKVALTAVTDAESTALSGPDKAAQAAKDIVSSAEGAGLQAGSSFVNYLIETAVNAIKYFIPAAKTAPNPASRPPATAPASAQQGQHGVEPQVQK